MNLKCSDFPQNWLKYRLEHGEFRNEIEKGITWLVFEILNYEY